MVLMFSEHCGNENYIDMFRKICLKRYYVVSKYF